MKKLSAIAFAMLPLLLAACGNKGPLVKPSQVAPAEPVLAPVVPDTTPTPVAEPAATQVTPAAAPEPATESAPAAAPEPATEPAPVAAPEPAPAADDSDG